MNPAILLVDDEQSICSALHRTFKRNKYRVFQANNGQQALSVLKENHIDVVVSDQKMPGMSGTQLLTIVKKRYPKIGRIILSGYSNKEDLSDSISKAGVDKFLSKPWNDEQLIKSVNNSIAKPSIKTDVNNGFGIADAIPELPCDTENIKKQKITIAKKSTIKDAFTQLHIDLEHAIKNDALLLEEHQCISRIANDTTLRYLKFSWPDFLGINHRGLINTAYQADYIRDLFTWYLLKSIEHMEYHSERDEDIIIDLFYPLFLRDASLILLLKKLISQKPNIILRVSFELLQDYRLEALLSNIYRSNKCLMLNIGAFMIDVNQLKNTPIKYIEIEKSSNVPSNHLLTEMHSNMTSAAREKLIKTVLSRSSQKVQQEYAQEVGVDFW